MHVLTHTRLAQGLGILAAALLLPVVKGTTAEGIVLRESAERYLAVPDISISYPGTRDPEEDMDPH